jgi:very-short-patch-repair endonuclease
MERIKVTTIARTILDCAAIFGPDEDHVLEEMCAVAHSKGTKAPALLKQIERNPGKPGVPRLAELLKRHVPKGPKRELERRLLRLVRNSDLPEPEVNQFLLGKERDLIWRDEKVVVETDSYRFHGDARTWSRDIGKTNDLQLEGYVVLRFTWFDVTERPQWVLGKIRKALARHA